MITIQFRNVNDAFLIQGLLNNYDIKKVNIRMITDQEPLIKIDSDEETLNYFILHSLIPAMTDYIKTAVETKWMKEMIQTMFYFTDVEEQRQILMIARSVIDEEESQKRSCKLQRDMRINESLKNFLSHSIAFSFESFLQFRLKQYRDSLLKYVEKAIDEYKLEQEYQAFIEHLRQVVLNKEPLLKTLHIVHNDEFIFYDDSFTLLPKEFLKSCIDFEVINPMEIDIESLYLAPLISIAPSKLYLYTNDIDKGIVQTVQNIFQERLHICSKKAFYKEELKGNNL